MMTFLLVISDNCPPIKSNGFVRQTGVIVLHYVDNS